MTKLEYKNILAKVIKRTIYCRKWHQKNDKLIYAKNPKRRLKINQAWEKRNKVKANLRYRRYYQKNKAKCLAYTLQRYHERKLIDPIFHLKKILRGRLYNGLLGKGTKVTLTQTYLGCSYAFFYQYIDILLKKAYKKDKRMTWQNKGKWHLDHIKPVCLFDLKKVEEQFACFNWSNIQPLWGSENIAKGRKYEN